MNTRRGSSTSEASSTLSEFVRRRYNGEVPIFGGDPRVGAAELGSAVSTTVNGQLTTVLSGLNETLRSMRGLPSVSSPIRRPLPLTLRNNDPNDSELRAAAELDDEKIRLLLDASLVEPGDMEKYFSLLAIARDGIAKKQASVAAGKARKAAMLRVDSLVTDDEIVAAHGANLDAVDAFAVKLGFVSDTSKFACRRAFIHESRFNGRTTNRGLAQLGDAALALLLKHFTCKNNISVGDTSGLLQATQTNLALRELGIKIKLDLFMVAGLNIDKTSRTVMATVVEALFGVAYNEGGMEMVAAINEAHVKVCEFDKIYRPDVKV